MKKETKEMEWDREVEVLLAYWEESTPMISILVSDPNWDDLLWDGLFEQAVAIGWGLA